VHNLLRLVAASDYLRDILDQPRALAATLEDLRVGPGIDRLRQELISRRRRRIVLTGMGGSYHTLHPLHFRLLNAGFDSVLVETSELLTTVPRLLAAENALLIVSQSGASAETIRLLDRVEQAPDRPLVLGVSNTVDSPLARRAHACVMTRAGPEATVSCKTALTALAALEWMGEYLCGGDVDVLQDELAALPAAIEAYLERWSEHVRWLQNELADVRSVFAVGRGRSLAAAEIGGMIQKEAAHVHGEGMSSPAFRHGPMEFLSAEIFVMIFDGDPEVSALNRSLLRDIRAAGGRAALIGSEEADGAFGLPLAAGRLRPILEMLPPQMVSLALAAAQGRTPGAFTRLTKITTTE
jgi:glutamine---fructose-6-phosphate transaminase (isomerizing)